MTDHLFVYGSLMSALAHPMGDQLRLEASLVGPARIAGRLHRVSWYPGLRPAKTATKTGSPTIEPVSSTPIQPAPATAAPAKAETGTKAAPTGAAAAPAPHKGK